MSQDYQKDEALFEELSKKKKRRRRRVLITVIVIVLLVAVALTITVFTLRRRVMLNNLSGVEVLSARVTTGTLSTVVSGKGTLAEETLESITVPEGVEITEVMVEAYDTVEAGQLLARVDMPSVLTAMATLQETMEDLDDQISDAKDDKVSSYITTEVVGRVKILYGEKDMQVTACMAEHGALAVLSLDGYMALDLQTDALSAGDEVTVLREDGKELTGTVDTCIGGVATILVTDNGPRQDEEVTVSLDGQALGTGKLYVHEPLAITGFAGTIQTVQVQENQMLYKNAPLFRLTDTDTHYNFDTLLRTRQELEEDLLVLLDLRNNGAVLAPFSGSIISVDHDETAAPTSVVTISPDEKMTVSLSVDESDILSLALGQEAEITVASVSEDIYMGTVTEIDRNSVSSGTYTAVVTLDKAEGMLAGMTASVDIRITGVADALLIPIEALHETRTGAYVYTTYDAETETFGGETPVVVGIMGSTQVEIISGLSEGDTVWYKEEMTIFDFFSNMSGMGGTSSAGPAMPSGGSSGGQRPGGGMPSGGGMPGGMPSGGPPSGGGMPGGWG